MLVLSRLLAIAYVLLVLVVVGLTALFGPLPMSSAPFPLPIGPEREPVTVLVAYSTEKQEWIEEAAARFAETNPTVRGHPITIQLQDGGSRELVEQVINGTLQPIAISPASSIQIELLRSEWEQQQGGTILMGGSDAPQPLVLTPLVIVAWDERAQVLWPDGASSDFWQRLHDALADPQGWAQYGKDTWGFVRFGHTSPTTSNSGIQTLVLLAYAYHNKTDGLTVADVQDPGFQSWLDDIEGSVEEFGDSTGTFMQNMVNFGPGKYDFVAVYENLALDNVEAARGRWNQPIRIYYPPDTFVSEHPYALLDAPWATDVQQDGAALFRDYLLSDEMQTLARSYGFRPASERVSIRDNDPANPFNNYQDYGVQPEVLPPQVATPSAAVLAELITLWESKGYAR